MYELGFFLYKGIQPMSLEIVTTAKMMRCCYYYLLD